MTVHLFGEPTADPPPQPPHWLIVGAQFDSDNPHDHMEVEHSPQCPQHTEGEGQGAYLVYDCWVGLEVSQAGLDAFVDERDPEPLNRYHAEPVQPGRWPIEAWSETHRGFDYVEYSGGVRLA